MKDSLLRCQTQGGLTARNDVIAELKHSAGLTLSRFSPDGQYFFTVDQKNLIHIYNISELVNSKPQEPSPKSQICRGHSDAINDANFSPDSKYIVSGSNDFTVRIWDLQGNEIQMFTGHKAKIQKCKFSSDGKYILSCSNDHTARLMPVSVGMVLDKINKEKVRGDVYQLTEEELKIFGIK